MKFSDQFRTGWRNLGRQKLRSSLTIFAIVIGALSVTVMLSLVTSAKSFLNSSLERTGEDRRVIVTRVKGVDYRQASEGDTAGDSDNAPQISDDVVKQVGAIPNVEHFTPVAYADFFRRVSLPGGGESARRPRVVAYEPNGTVVRDLSAGRELTADDAADNGVLITTTIANGLGFRGNLAGIVGQTIQLNWDEKFFQGQQETDKRALQCAPGNDFPDCANNKQNKEKCAQNPGPDCAKELENARLADEAYQKASSGNQNSSPTVAPISAKVVGVYAADGDFIDMNLSSAIALSPEQEYCPPGNDGSSGACEKRKLVLWQGYSSVFLSVDAKRNVEGVATEVERVGSYGAATGLDQIDQQNRAFTIIGAVLGGIGGIALLVAAIGVINTMVMATLERTREIGIMRALGATKRTIKRLFTVEAAFLGFLGGLVGVALSFAVMVGLNQIINKQLEHGGVSARDVMKVPIGLGIVVIVGTTLIGVVAGRLPARRAANLDPVEALRYE